MLNQLRQLERNKSPIRVALVGAGSMGLGIAWQLGRTPGIELSFVADLSLTAAEKAAQASGQPVVRADERDAGCGASSACLVSANPLSLLQDPSIEFDVLVEATNAIGWAGRYCRVAVARSAHVVLMNAEVDLALGPLLQYEAARQGVIVSSDGGDQHGVLKRMMDEIELWGFRIVQAGNIKGFLDRYATAAMLADEAAKRHLNPIQCCGYTDGTKLNIEMALISNGTGLIPSVPGMEGPACAHVGDVMNLFDFEAYGRQGRVDYILGAEPGGGVYVVGHCDDALQAQYLEYYKLGAGPYYLFYRPYHLCHLETPRVIAEAVLNRTALLTPACGLVADVFAYAKQRIKAGTVIDHAIGGDCFYGLVESANEAAQADHVPIALLEPEHAQQARITRDIAKDQPLVWDAVEMPDTYLYESWHEQKRVLNSG